ncbi:MAG TPA: membrane protein insertase YidC [Vicinamibacterales bacterium]|jgi:YidC/Oxa1 family membrane protein insertase
MEKRLLVAIFLSFLVLYGYQVFVIKPAQDAAAKNKAVAATLAPTPAAVAAQSPGGDRPPISVEVAANAQPAAVKTGLPIVADETERDVVVETRHVRAVFTNRGAHLKSWRLKQYLDLQKKPQELVPQYLGPEHARPFELKVDDAAITRQVNEALFKVSGGGDPVDATRQAQTVVFDYKDASGLAARKEFTFEPASFTLRVSAQVLVGDRALNPTVLWGPGLGDQIPGAESSSYIQKPEGIVVREDKVQRLASKDLPAAPVQEGDMTAAGVDDHYFIAMALPKKMVRVEYSPVTLPAPAGRDPKKVTELVAWGVRQKESMSNLTFFFGPKDFDVLEALDRRLVRTINYGIFDFLAVPLLRALKWINGYVGNYGWAIIILTFLINAVMFPLRHKSMVSMRKMQEIQPLVKGIQDRYGKLKATDPERQKMNTEVMSLYKEKGVNPASGCFPMLLTMPVLFAFYSLLSQAIEIRGMPFTLWITDLSAHDPYYVTPILMGASQLWQQRMTPSSADPVQQKMMMFMPLVFTFMFLWVPSGLVLYWFVSNLLAIGQQYITNNLVGPANTARPAAERKTKGKS